MESFEVGREFGLDEVSSDVFWEGVFRGKELLEDSSVESDAMFVPAFEDVERSRNVVYIPDIHGDFVGLRRALLNFNLIDENLRWIGGDTKVVFLGDLIDRGGADRWVLDYLIELKKQIFEAGGEMVTLVGNHDLYVLNALYGDSRVMPERRHQMSFVEQCKGLRESFRIAFDDWSAQAFRDLMFGSDKYSKYVNFWNSMVPFDFENSVLAVHGGINLKWSSRLLRDGVDDVNHSFRLALEEGGLAEWSAVPYTRRGWTDTSLSSPMWHDYSDMYKLSDQDRAYLYDDLRRLRVNLVLCGHQRHYSVRCFSLIDKFELNPIRFVCLDTSITKGYEGVTNNGGLLISKENTVGFMDAKSTGVDIGFDEMLCFR